uniref:Reverse transcriptase n=1 Tax=Knipowitschia caucasica TaxID=637954 RepID=A0AAV2IZ80_KNICA
MPTEENRLKQKDAMGFEQGDLMLRDQFVMGLKDGPIRQELRRQVRKRPALTFDEVKTEALAIEEEQAEQWPPHDCLVVTLFSESVCRNLLGGEKLRGSKELPWLTLRAANGLNIPWVGYLVADFVVQGVRVPARGIVVAKDSCVGADIAILGMNVIADCWEELFNKCQVSSKRSKPLLGREWHSVFADCQRIRTVSSADPWKATARLASRTPVTIPAQSEMTLWAKIPLSSQHWQCEALVEPLGENGGVEVARALVTVGKGRIPVRLRNIHPYAVQLSRFQRLATVTAIDPDSIRDGKELSLVEVDPGVVEVRLVDAAPKPEATNVSPAIPVPGGDGLTEEEQGKLDKLLNRWRHVFSTHEEDYGRTSAVKHTITTGDANPIRERYRSFTEHLQHLESVFRSLGYYGLKLRPEKCQLFQKQAPGDPDQLVGVVETAITPTIGGSLGWDVARWRSLQAEDPDLRKIQPHIERDGTPRARAIPESAAKEFLLAPNGGHNRHLATSLPALCITQARTPR